MSAKPKANTASGPPPKKPKSPLDLYVLECFKSMDHDDDLIDLGELPEARLRTVLRLVSADAKFGDGMDRGELLGAAGELLAIEGNTIRFKKSLVQIEAKAKWLLMSSDERRPYEEKVRQRALAQYKFRIRFRLHL